MKIIPAVDILEGKVVRLFKGSFQERKEYSNDPVSIAKFWQDQGAQFLHVVDLDGAMSGQPKNFRVINKVINGVSIPVEVGGGIRTVDNLKKYIDYGADRIVLSTVVINNLSFLDKKELKGVIDKIAISCDSEKAISFDKKNIAYITTGTDAWIQQRKIIPSELIGKMASVGVRYLNYTDRSKDGTLTGLRDDDASKLDNFLNSIGTKPISATYAGGVASLEDIKKLAQLKNKRLEGVIIGKALYEEKFSIKQAQVEIEKITNVS